MQVVYFHRVIKVILLLNMLQKFLEKIFSLALYIMKHLPCPGCAAYIVLYIIHL